MSILKEFKEFALKGNLIDMAVAFVMGAAFGKLVTGFIDGIVMPLIGKIIADVDFKSLKFVLSEARINATGKVISAEISIKYGEFITIFIDFLLVAFVMLMLIKLINKAKRKQSVASTEPAQQSKEEILLSEIRDLLKKK
jgi:large conductance mechanosensitive channel